MVAQAVLVKSVLTVLTLRNFKKFPLELCFKVLPKDKKKGENVSVGI